MMLPNVIIAGAPKSGTTSVFNWLADHPEVCASSVKETYYLMDREYPLFNPKHNYLNNGLEGYNFFFKNNNKVILEATPDYLYQQTAPEVISKLNPTPNIIFILRKPSERVYSTYKFFRGHKAIIDNNITFSEFIYRIKNEPKSFSHNLGKLLQEVIKQSQYIVYLNYWLSKINPDNIHIFLFEELQQDSKAFMTHLSNRIHINPSFYDNYSFPIYNISYSVKSTSFHRLKNKLTRYLPNGSYRKYTSWLYKRLNVNNNGFTKPLEDLKTIKDLDNIFYFYNKRLEEKFNIDLSIWS